MTTWQLTVDCADVSLLAAFWAAALGYRAAPPPVGYADWDSWEAAYGVPVEERGGGATIEHAAGKGPRLCFLRVPERKVTKNRLHLDLQVGGGRHTPWPQRWSRVVEEVLRLERLGASSLVTVELAGQPDHVVMADPEGNEFCVV